MKRRTVCVKFNAFFQKAIIQIIWIFHRRWFILAVILGLGAFLRFFALTDHYFYPIDSTVQVSGAENIFLHGYYPYPHYAPPGPGIALIPFMAFSDFSIMSAQVGIAFYGVALIGLSWLLVKRLSPTSRLAPYLVALFVAINPALIASSRVALFDVMQLVFIAAYFIVLTSHRSYQSRRPATILLSCAIAVFLVLMKTPNVIVVGLGFLYLLGQPWMERASAGQRRRQWAWTGLALVLFALFLWALYSTILTQEGTKIATAAAGQFGLHNVLPNLEALLTSLGNPLDPPATSMVFAANLAPVSLLQLVLGFGLAAVLSIGLIASLRRRGGDAAVLLAFGVIQACLFFFFRGFKMRYYYPLLLVSLCFLGIGLERLIRTVSDRNRPTRRLVVISSVILLILVITPVAMSLRADGEMLAAWNSKDSLRLNGAPLFPEDVREVSGLIDQHPDAYVVSSIASLIDVVDKHRDEPVLDLHRLAVEKEPFVGVKRDRANSKRRRSLIHHCLADHQAAPQGV